VRIQPIHQVRIPNLDAAVETPDCDKAPTSFGWTGEVEPFDTKGERWEHEVVMDIEVLVGLVVDVKVESGKVGCGSSGDEHIVGWKESELFPFELVVVLHQGSGRIIKTRIRSDFFQCDVWVFIVIPVEGQAFDIGESAHG